jgi:AraC-like DNA-binding protein
MPMSELANSFITLAEAPGGAAWRELGERLKASASSEQKFELLDQFFLRRIASTTDFPEGVAWAWNEIQRHAGLVPVASLTASLGVTRKRMVQDFREYVGLPPKTIARIARFNRALRMMEQQPGRPAWTRIAAECGYYDQAHFIREVRSLTGDTPTELLGRLTRAGRAS